VLNLSVWRPNNLDRDMAMKTSLLLRFLFATLLAAATSSAAAGTKTNAAERGTLPGSPMFAPDAAVGGIDWDKARTLYQRNQRGDWLTPKIEPGANYDE
jgi:hypothetical protein